MFDSATSRTIAYHASPSMRFSKQECWSGLPFPSPGNLPNPGIEPGSPALQADTLLSEPPGKPLYIHTHAYYALKWDSNNPYLIGMAWMNTYIFCVDTIYNICVILVHPCHPYEVGIIVIPFQGLSTMRLSNCPKSRYIQEVAVI